MTNTNEHLEEHAESEGPIKTPKQLLAVVILAFLIPIVIIIMLVNLVAATTSSGAGSTAQTPESIASRIKPVAQFKLVDANAPKVFQTGQQVFDTTCSACHTAGVAGAPKIGDQAAWATYIKTGYEEMVKNAIHGIRAMPPRGGNASLSDLEVERAVVYLANKSGASFKEPEAPADDKKAAANEPAAAKTAATETTPPAAANSTAKAPAPAESTAVAAAAPAKPAPAAEKAAAPAAATIDPAGEKLYKSVCFACHDTGAAGAPKHGDKAAWAPFVATGLDTMVANAIHGIGAMPPRGGSQATDAEMRAAVEYLVAAVK